MMDIVSHLKDTRRAFDSVAADYDGPAGNNAVVQEMRTRMWRALETIFPQGARLLDLGCGTGIDTVHLALRGYSIVAIDWSPAMVARTRDRIRQYGVEARASAHVLGMHELARYQVPSTEYRAPSAGSRFKVHSSKCRAWCDSTESRQPMAQQPVGESTGTLYSVLSTSSFDGIYANLGSINCTPDLRGTAQACAALLKPGGRVVASVIGRACPWEVGYYALRRDWQRAVVRRTTGCVPVPLNGHIVWTRYYTPREFSRVFAPEFELTSYRGLCISVPPPYLVSIYQRLGWASKILGRIDDAIGDLPLVRNLGDHFLMVLTRAETSDER